MPEMESTMKAPTGAWSAPGPVTLYFRELWLSPSDRICVGEHIFSVGQRINSQQAI
jgi:hypothetical protein